MLVFKNTVIEETYLLIAIAAAGAGTSLSDCQSYFLTSKQLLFNMM